MVHKIIIRESEFSNLVREFPKKDELLNSISDFLGPKKVIRLTPQAKDRLGSELIDRLYRLDRPLNKDKFLSYFYQLCGILNLPKSKVNSILDVGPGEGMLESLIKNYDYDIVTLDIDLEKNPEVNGDVINSPIKSKSFDLVCAFETLQHIPYSFFKQAVGELARCARHYVYISLPCPVSSIYFQCKVNFLQRLLKKFSFNLWWACTLPTKIIDKNEDELLKRNDRHNPHYWELNRRSFPKHKVLREIEGCGLRVIKKFHNPFYPYHYFILCETKQQ